MSWKRAKPGRFSLQEAASEILPGSRVSSSSVGIKVVAVKRGAVVAVGSADNSLDFLCRLAMWGLLPAMFFAMIWAALHPFMYKQGGMFLVAFLFGGLGLLCSRNLNDSFTSKVREQLGKARAASSKEEILVETLLLVWAMREARPAFATIVNVGVSWNSYSNNTNLFAIQPAQRALAFLTELGDDQREYDWGRRNEFRGYLNQIEAKLDALESMWSRVAHVPEYFHRIAFYGGGFLTVIHLLGPLAERLR